MFAWTTRVKAERRRPVRQLATAAVFRALAEAPADRRSAADLAATAHLTVEAVERILRKARIRLLVKTPEHGQWEPTEMMIRNPIQLTADRFQG
jgi:hypothetical protein